MKLQCNLWVSYAKSHAEDLAKGCSMHQNAPVLYSFSFVRVHRFLYENGLYMFKTTHVLSLAISTKITKVLDAIDWSYFLKRM